VLLCSTPGSGHHRRVGLEAQASHPFTGQQHVQEPAHQLRVLGRVVHRPAVAFADHRVGERVGQLCAQAEQQLIRLAVVHRHHRVHQRRVALDQYR
jgi:hypothetical protein